MGLSARRDDAYTTRSVSTMPRGMTLSRVAPRASAHRAFVGGPSTKGCAL